MLSMVSSMTSADRGVQNCHTRNIILCLREYMCRFRSLRCSFLQKVGGGSYFGWRVFKITLWRQQSSSSPGYSEEGDGRMQM